MFPWDLAPVNHGKARRSGSLGRAKRPWKNSSCGQCARSKGVFTLPYGVGWACIDGSWFGSGGCDKWTSGVQGERESACGSDLYHEVGLLVLAAPIW